MKKLVFAFAAVVALTFASCGGNTQNTVANDSDSIAADSAVVEDTLSADTLSADTLGADTLSADTL